MLNTSSVADVFLGISENIQKSYFKRKPDKSLFINLSYFIKEHLWMSASDEATLKVDLENTMVP